MQVLCQDKKRGWRSWIMLKIPTQEDLWQGPLPQKIKACQSTRPECQLNEVGERLNLRTMIRHVNIPQSKMRDLRNGAYGSLGQSDDL
jgi:hypothetical protein